jgi:hypothetical protein
VHIAHQAIDYGNQQGCPLFTADFKRGAQLRALRRGVRTLASLDFLELSDKLPCAAIQESAHRFPLRL